MNIKAFLKQLTPPIAMQLYRRVTRRRYFWSGIYNHYQEVPNAGGGFADPMYVKLTVKQAQDLISISQLYGSIPTECINEYAQLTVLSSALCKQNGGYLRVLDYGGSLGLHYVHLKSSIVDCKSLDYHIVELDWACREGPKLYTDEHIHFHNRLPEHLHGIDIVYMSGTLMFVEDYESLMKRLCVYRASYFMFADLYAGDFRTFASAQKGFRGSILPFWFFNADELVNIMNREGYSLICKAALAETYNQDNFPEQYRLDRGRTSTFLFARD